MTHPNLRLLASIIVVLSTLSVSSLVHAQTSAQERADALRLQLEELKTKQLDLEARLQTLEEQSQPENIEKSLAGVGSTHPEDLREFRRKQFDKEKQSLKQQLDLLNKSQTRLETAIAQADADAYHQSAKGPSITTTPDNSTTTNVSKTVRPRRVRKRARN